MATKKKAAPKAAATPRTPKIEIFPGKNPKDPLGDPAYFFRVKAGNGEIIAASESYTRRLDATKAAQALKRAVTEAKIFEVEA